jgi:hypothetical protein
MNEIASSRQSRKSLLHALPALRIEHVWAILALTIVAGFVALVPTLPNDFWWHLAAGRIIAQEGIPTTNLFAWSLPADTPYIYQSWLGEWLFYAIYSIGGFQLIGFARNLLFTLTFGLMGYEAYRRSGSWRLAALAIIVAGLMSMNNLTTRTQNWSMLPFIGTSLILGAYVDGRLHQRWLWAIPLIMAFWVNAHGAFMTGLLMIGAYVVAETARRFLRHSRALSWDRLRWLYIVAGASLLAIMINPLGPGIFGYVGLLLSDPSSQTLIGEWQPPTTRSYAGKAFYIGFLALVAAFGLARRRPTLTDIVLVCGFGWMAISGQRYVLWFALIAMPILAQSLAAARSPLTAAPRQAVFPLANVISAVALLLFLLSLQPWTKHLYPWPEPYRNLFVDFPGAPQIFSANTPYAATEHLLAQPCEGRLFNEMGQGSYLAWALYPAGQSFIDTRVELFPLAQWHDYIALNQGRELDLLDEKYQISCVMLDSVIQPNLAQAMQERAGWQLSFEDGQSQVWRRQ